MSDFQLWMIVLAVTALVMGIQTLLSKLRNPIFGAFLPCIILIIGICTFTILEIEFTWKILFAVLLPFIWSLEEWNKGRKKRKEQETKELERMKAKDIV